MEKVKLPQEVGEAIAIYRTGNSLDTLLVDCADEMISDPILSYWRSHDNCTAIFADAWRYGWEPLPEPEKKFYVFVPKTKRSFKYAILQDRVVVYDWSMREVCKELTKKQINQFNLEGYECEEVTDD